MPSKTQTTTKTQAQPVYMVPPRETNSNSNNLLFAVLGLLVLMSVIQTFQFRSLANAMTNGSVASNGSSRQVRSNQAPSRNSGSVQLPSQVGGCGS